MKRLYISVVAGVLLAGCATRAPQPGTVIAAERFSQVVVPGRTTRGELLAAFGPTRSVTFDSGYQSWLYSAGSGEELVLLLDRDGIVRKMRRRPAYSTDKPR